MNKILFHSIIRFTHVRFDCRRLLSACFIYLLMLKANVFFCWENRMKIFTCLFNVILFYIIAPNKLFFIWNIIKNLCVYLRTCKQNMFSKLLKLYIIQKKSNISLDINIRFYKQNQSKILSLASIKL